MGWEGLEKEVDKVPILNYYCQESWSFDLRRDLRAVHLSLVADAKCTPSLLASTPLLE